MRTALLHSICGGSKDLPAARFGCVRRWIPKMGSVHGLVLREPVAGRIRTAPNAEHTFEAYTSPGEIFKNQQRQIIGQTIVHVLVDQHLKNLPVEARKNLAETLREAENRNPDWLKVKLADHLRGVSLSWQLYPYLATQRFRSLKHLPWAQRLRSLPSAAAASAVTLAASLPAMRKLKKGCTSYWPKASRNSAGLSPQLSRKPNIST